MSTPDNWLDEQIPLRRPEYAKQMEALLTDLLWRSDGSSLAAQGLYSQLGALSASAARGMPEPDRLVPRFRHGGSPKVCETMPIASTVDLSALVAQPTDTSTPVQALLWSCLAPLARGEKSIACVPVNPSIVCLQTLHGFVNKESPANLSHIIETMGQLGGAPSHGSIAAAFLHAQSANPLGPRDGLSGFLDASFPLVASHVWRELPARFQASPQGWAAWPGVVATTLPAGVPLALAQHPRTPFAWFWRKWQRLCDPSREWHELLPSRRFVDWAQCLLRTGLAFSYLWEAEFYCRLHERIVERFQQVATPVNRLRTMLTEGAILAEFEPTFVPASQKDAWPAIRLLISRGYEARRRIFDLLDGDTGSSTTQSLQQRLEAWVQGLSNPELEGAAAPIEINDRTANNQREFVRYLLRARTSDDDVVDQADFYYLARTNSRNMWFHPGPEWLVVLSSLLCERPGGQTTLGSLVADLSALGIRIDRSVLVSLLEEAGLSTDSPDADDALVIRSGF